MVYHLILAILKLNVKKSDCDNAFDDLLPNEKVKCNKKSGICDRYLHVDKHIEPSVDCRKKLIKN